MKSMLMALAVILVSAQSFGAERVYRVNENQITKKGFAIAWGAKNKKADFEAIERAGDKAVSDFVSGNELLNYIVDIPNDTILYTFEADGEVKGSIGNMGLGNHYYVDVTEATADGLNYDQDLLILTTGRKWFGGMLDAVVVDRSDYNSRVVAKCGDCPAQFTKQLMAAITKKYGKKTAKKFDDLDSQISSFELVSTSRGPMVKYTEERSVIKGEDYMTMEGFVKFAVKDNKVTLSVISALQKKN